MARFDFAPRFAGFLGNFPSTVERTYYRSMLYGPAIAMADVRPTMPGEGRGKEHRARHCSSDGSPHKHARARERRRRQEEKRLARAASREEKHGSPAKSGHSCPS